MSSHHVPRVQNGMGNHTHNMVDASARFARFPSESITLCGESIGVEINQKIEDLLVEDVSYRTRQVARVCTLCKL